MNNIFLYLYPIEEYTLEFSRLHDDSLKVLNETIDKRYRENGYKIVYALFKDKDTYGIDLRSDDTIIYTDVTYDEAVGTYSKPKYADPEYLLNQLGNIDNLVIGGYHSMDCCMKVADYAMKKGINTLVDLELTDLFFNNYESEDFDISKYNKKAFKRRTLDYIGEGVFGESIFYSMFNNPVYGFYEEDLRLIK